MIRTLDTLDSDRESMGSLKALLRENEKGRRSRASMGNLINPGFIAFWADTRKGRNAHGGCNEGKWLLGIPGRAYLCASTVRSSGFEG